MFGALYLTIVLFYILIIISTIFGIIIMRSKDKLKTIYHIDIGLLFFTILFFFVWFPIEENTQLKINNYLVITNYDEIVPEVSYYLVDRGYLKYLSKIKDSWVGYIYDFDEATSEILDATNSMVIMLDEKGINANREEYNKYSGYFIINSQNQLFHLSENEVKEKLELNKINLGNPEKVIKKYGEKKEKSIFYKIVDDYFIPFSDFKFEIKGYNIIKYSTIILLILKILFLKSKIHKQRKE